MKQTSSEQPPIVWPSRITDEALDRVIQSPTVFAAWVLRAVAVELKKRRKDDEARFANKHGY